MARTWFDVTRQSTPATTGSYILIHKPLHTPSDPRPQQCTMATTKAGRWRLVLAAAVMLWPTKKCKMHTAVLHASTDRVSLRSLLQGSTQAPLDLQQQAEVIWLACRWPATYKPDSQQAVHCTSPNHQFSMLQLHQRWCSPLAKKVYTKRQRCTSWYSTKNSTEMPPLGSTAWACVVALMQRLPTEKITTTDSKCRSGHSKPLVKPVELI